MLGFFIAFAVKMPLVPLHGWLPDAHSSGTDRGFRGLGGDPAEDRRLRPAALRSAAVPRMRPPNLPPIAHGGSASHRHRLRRASLSFAQTDIKRLVAYSSVSHMGFVLIAIYSASEIALQGAVVADDGARPVRRGAVYPLWPVV